MKSKRKTMLGVAFAVAVIALAGIGYAAYDGYTATTTNHGNAVTTVYNKITLGTNASADYTNFMVDDGIEFDSVTNDAVTTYSFHNLAYKIKDTSGTYTIDDSLPSATAVKVSDDLTVTVDALNGGAGALFLKVNKTFVLDTVVFLVNVDGTFYTMSSLVAPSGNGTNVGTFAKADGETFTVSVYAYVATNSFDLESASNVLSGVTFTFTAVEGTA